MTKNITVDEDLVAMLNSVADKLVKELGFRPTLSQTLRYLIIKERNAGTHCARGESHEDS